MKFLLVILISFSCFGRPFFRRGQPVKIKRQLTVFEAMAGCSRNGRIRNYKKIKGKYKYHVKFGNCAVTKWFLEGQIR